MLVLRTHQELRGQVEKIRLSRKTIGFVPTMGALHAGHLSLGTEARKACDTVIYSIFVNPLQFAPHEDFGRYPRSEEADLAQLEAAGVDMVFLPQVADMYPEEFMTRVSVSGITAPLEGEFRPDFFGGVATVVTKLLLQVLPTHAFFGEKDYQQLQTIKRLCRDLSVPVEIVGVPTLRDENGLALSSRNAYLTPEQYEIACMLNRTLIGMGILAQQGEKFSRVEEMGHDSLIKAGFDRVDYCVVRDANTLLPPQKVAPLRVLGAAWLGSTRLIDNMPV